jgi:hypothetical protein
VSDFDWYWRTANAKYEVEYREAIAITIPSLVKLLEDKETDVRRKIIELIGELANHGAWQLDGITA